MINAPDISVVMSVYDGATSLCRTIDSILTQGGVTLEFIVINDGSTDETADILAAYAKADDRLRVIDQENCGLTRSLKLGCSLARGEFIARQDAGDVSLPGRLARQRERLMAYPDATMISTAARFLGPEGEELYTISQTDESAVEGLVQLNDVRGPPHHGSTMFRRSAYESVGGYREAFIVAQDIDLWLRLVEEGQPLAISDTYYEATLLPRSISARWRDQQIFSAKTIVECARMRRAGESDVAFLAQRLQSLRSAAADTKSTSAAEARFFYFMGRSLIQRDRHRARGYFTMAIRRRPMFVKAWSALLRSGAFL